MRSVSWFVAVIASIVALVIQAEAGPLEGGGAANDRGDYSEAWKWFMLGPPVDPEVLAYDIPVAEPVPYRGLSRESGQ